MRYKHVLLERFVYPTWNSSIGYCQIECYPIVGDRVLVLATELADNPGMSITNAVELVATEVVHQLHLDPQHLIWVEHYGYSDPVRPERPRSFDRVTFGSIEPTDHPIFRVPQWRPMTSRDWRDLGLDPAELATGSSQKPTFPENTGLFSLGQCVITANAENVLYPADIPIALARHARGDWGELDPHDRRENELALKQGRRLFSVYRDRSNQKFYIITEADRSVTTILLPEDY